MKFIKCLKNDIRQGILREWIYLLPITGLVILFCVDFLSKSQEICKMNELQVDVSIWDYFLYVFGGMEYYEPSPTNPFSFPVIWIITMAYSSFLVIRYPYKLLDTYGIQIVIRSGRRIRWWTSKCSWMVVMTLLYYLIIYILILFVGTLLGGTLDSSIHNVYANELFRTYIDDVQLNWSQGMVLLCGPVLVSLALNMMQLFTGMVWNGALSFLITLGILISSAYFMNIALIGNGAMFIRSNILFPGGIRMDISFAIEAGISILFFFLGMYWFLKKDILKKEDGK